MSMCRDERQKTQQDIIWWDLSIKLNQCFRLSVWGITQSCWLLNLSYMFISCYNNESQALISQQGNPMHTACKAKKRHRVAKIRGELEAGWIMIMGDIGCKHAPLQMILDIAGNSACTVDKDRAEDSKYGEGWWMAENGCWGWCILINAIRLKFTK